MALAPQIGHAAREAVDYVTDTELMSGQRWVDGRPIRQTTLAWHPDLLNASNALPHNIPNIANVVAVDGIMWSGTNAMPLSNYAVTVATPANGTITVANAQTLQGWITVYFVRTTDPIPLRTD